MSEDLTNLNWLSYAPIELNESTQVISVKCISTIKKSKNSSKGSNNQTPANTAASRPDSHTTDTEEEIAGNKSKSSKKKQDSESIEQKKMNRLIQRTFHKRPQCSYSCLITMALKASDTGCLPVHLIYKYIEQEFPYFRTAPEGWKNSIRHNLSMNQNFIKVCRNEIPTTKKGFLWAINPSRVESLNLEIEKTLKAMGRKLIENGEDRIPKQFSRNCEQLFSAQSVMNTADHFPPSLAAMATSPTTGKHSSHCSSSYSKELYECVSRHVSLKTLNSISGLKLRDRRNNATTCSSSKLDWFPLFPEKQSSSEAVNHLFGVSVVPDIIEDIPPQISSNYQLKSTSSSDELMSTAAGGHYHYDASSALPSQYIPCSMYKFTHRGSLSQFPYTCSYSGCCSSSDTSISITSTAADTSEDENISSITISTDNPSDGECKSVAEEGESDLDNGNYQSTECFYSAQS